MQLTKFISDNINKHGRAILCIFPDEENDEPSFSYTIGNSLAGYPELLVLGSHPGWGQAVLNELSEMQKTKPFINGQLVQLVGGKFPCKVIVANHVAREKYMIQARYYLGNESFSVLQVLICDGKGKFPDEAGCLEPYASLPVLKLQ